jgi:hypothetical protein
VIGDRCFCLVDGAGFSDSRCSWIARRSIPTILGHGARKPASGVARYFPTHYFPTHYCPTFPPSYSQFKKLIHVLFGDCCELFEGDASGGGDGGGGVEGEGGFVSLAAVRGGG